MAKLTHYVIHCTATPEGMEVTGDTLKQWHIGPAKLSTGQLKYKGQVYNTVNDLPKESIGGVPIEKLVGGRGWRQVGYADIIRLDGRVENIVPYNEDENVDAWEITNGILAANELYTHSRHIVYAGGMDKANKVPKDTRTEAQRISLVNKVRETIARHPDILIIGHNQIDPRACPSFVVPEWLRSIGVEEKNISKAELKYHA